VTSCVYIDCHQSWKCPKRHKMKSHVCDQSHHHDQPLCQRLALVGKKSSSDVTFPLQLMLEPAEDPCTRLVLPLICVIILTQEQTPNVTSNTSINVVRPLNESKCQCHLTVKIIVIATIIVADQNMCMTTAPLQLNRLQQSTIS
jgi:hypothetical protein